MSRSIVALLASLLAHGGVVALMWAGSPRAAVLPPLFIDLTGERPLTRETHVNGAPESPSDRVGRELHSTATRPAAEDRRRLASRNAPAVPPREVERPPAPVPRPVVPSPPSLVASVPSPPVPFHSLLVPSGPRHPDTVADSGDPWPASTGVTAAVGPRPAGSGEQSGSPTGAPAPGGRLLPEGAGNASSSPRPGFSRASGGPEQGATGSEYGPYLSAMRRLVQESLEYPLSARRRDLTGTVELEVVILPTGAIGDVMVARSSSHAVLDEAAVETLRRLPVLPFPRDVPPRVLRIRLPVVFDLR